VTAQLIVNGIIAGSLYALIALGFTVIYGTVRFFHFAHGVVFAVSAYMAWCCVSYLNLPLIIAGLIAVLGGGILGLLMNLFIYRSLRKRKAPNLILLLASFGLFLLLQNALQLGFGSDIKAIRIGSVNEGYRILGASITGTQIIIIIASVLLAGVVLLFMRKTRFGKAIRAVADDSVAASIVGVNSERTIAVAFFLGSALAGAAGVLVALETNIQPTMGLNAAIKGIIAALIGGMGSIPGALVGGLFLGLAENLGIWSISAGWKDAISFSILVLFLLFRPSGMFGSRSKGRKV